MSPESFAKIKTSKFCCPCANQANHISIWPYLVILNPTETVSVSLTDITQTMRNLKYYISTNIRNGQQCKAESRRLTMTCVVSSCNSHCVGALLAHWARSWYLSHKLVLFKYRACCHGRACCWLGGNDMSGGLNRKPRTSWVDSCYSLATSNQTQGPKQTLPTATSVWCAALRWETREFVVTAMTDCVIQNFLGWAMRSFSD